MAYRVYNPFAGREFAQLGISSLYGPTNAQYNALPLVLKPLGRVLVLPTPLNEVTDYEHSMEQFEYLALQLEEIAKTEDAFYTTGRCQWLLDQVDDMFLKETLRENGVYNQVERKLHRYLDANGPTDRYEPAMKKAYNAGYDKGYDSD